MTGLESLKSFFCIWPYEFRGKLTVGRKVVGVSQDLIAAYLIFFCLPQDLEFKLSGDSCLYEILWFVFFGFISGGASGNLFNLNV